MHIKTRVQKAWKGSVHQLVVFGDDWSDIGEYRISPPESSSIPTKDSDQGELWTEVLCNELVCDYIDNFAQSQPSSKDEVKTGALVSNDIYANATSPNKTEFVPLADFKTQVQQWINFEKQARLMPGRQSKDEWTVFTVLFGVWDIWQYARLERSKAIFAIERSIEEFFHHLNTLAEHSESTIKVVVPLLFDVTFLPRFQRRKADPANQFAQDQHLAVYLLAYWNTALSLSAVRWTGGEIFMPDLGRILVGQVRAKQLYAMRITDATGAGKESPLFDEVERPCLLPNSESEELGKLQTSGVKKCSYPSRHLFWDDMHLSGVAHRLIGKEAASLINSNNTFNTDALEQAKANGAMNGSGSTIISPNFKLHFPPE